MKMKIKLTITFVASSAVILCACIAAADDLPKALSFARYEPILNHSPFAVATAAVTATTADFAKDLFIANAAHSPDGDWVALASSTDNNFRKYLTTKQGMDGYSLSSIEWSEQVGATKVTVGKDGQFATLSFNQALLSSPLPRTAAMPINPAAGVIPNMNMNVTPDQPVNRIRPAPIPMLPTPPPRVRGVIPRNPVGRHRQMPVPAVVPQTIEQPQPEPEQ
jgi:hypothetical protein